MSKEKLTLARADLNNLLANLRGEVGEIITAWIVMRHFIVAGRKLETGDLTTDMRDKGIQFHRLMANKLEDDLVGRLSEIADRKIGRLNFYFVAKKMEAFADEVTAFERFIVGAKIREKRNRDVSHKELPGLNPDKKLFPLQVSYRALVRAVARMLRLMKRIDRRVLGPSSPFLWAEARKKRYDFLSPPRAGYMLIPHLNLSPEIRAKIVQLEVEEGKTVFHEMPTTIDGKPGSVLACKQWGVLLLGRRLVPLNSYPLIKLDTISTSEAT